MNWTGGRLQRSKQAGKGIAQIQKAHFARVRTRLQNGPSTINPPFHASDDAALGGHTTTSGPWLVSSVGHPRLPRQTPDNSRHGRIQHGFETEKRGSHQATVHADNEQTIEAACGKQSSGEHDTAWKHDRQPAEASLEARKRHLLQQEDWAGLKRSGPGPVLFSPCRERDKIGKRRKIRGGDALATVRMREARAPARRVGDPQRGAFRSGGLPAGDITVRIGTDALSDLAHTRQTPSPPQEDAPSLDAPSDIMLWDCEDSQTAPSPRPALVQIGNQDRPRLVGGFAPLRAASPEMRGEALHAHQAADQNEEALYQPRTLDAAQGHHVQRACDRGTSAGSVATTYGDNKVSMSSITKCPGDSQHALRHAIDRMSDCSAAVGEERALGDFAIGEPNRGYRLANAAPLQCGKQHGNSQIGMIAAAGQSTIVDDGPWRSFLSVSDNSSSHSSTAHASDTNVLHYREHPQSNRVSQSMSWSQHAVQGGQTRPDASSCISASLASLAQGSEEDALEKQPHHGPVRDTSFGKKQRDEGEQLWRGFVFGGGDIGACAVSDFHVTDAA